MVHIWFFLFAFFSFFLLNLWCDSLHHYYLSFVMGLSGLTKSADLLSKLALHQKVFYFVLNPAVEAMPPSVFSVISSEGDCFPSCL